MFNRASAFNQFRTLFAPRKPRHPLVRVAVGLLGLAILAAMVFIGVFVGAAMILVGLAWKLLASRKPGAARPVDPTVVEGEYRVVRKPVRVVGEASSHSSNRWQATPLDCRVLQAGLVDLQKSVAWLQRG